VEGCTPGYEICTETGTNDGSSFQLNNYFLPTKGVQFDVLIIKQKMARNFGVENGQMIRITSSVASSASNLR
jgi:hypothetical protein